MRTIIVIFLITLSFRLFSQDYKIEELKYKPVGYEYKYYPIGYPIFVLTDTTKSAEINLEIKKVTLDYWLQDTDSTFDDILSEIKFLMNPDLNNHRELTGYSYEIIFKKDELITIETDVEICDRAVWHIKNQFNIDIKLGKILTLQDIIYDEKFDTLEDILLDRKKEWSMYAISELKDSILTEKDKELIKLYKRGIMEIQDCLAEHYNHITKFFIRNNRIYFDDGCNLSDGVWNACPISTYPLKFNPERDYKGIIKEKYYNLIFGD